MSANAIIPPGPPTRYRITALDPHAHLFEVRVTVDLPDPDGQCFRLPAWIPGSYLIREFARNFVEVRAESASGAVTIDKIAKDRWRAAPCAGPLSVTATVHAFDLSVRTAYLDATRGYFNGTAVFLCPEGREDAPCVVDIAPPADPRFAHWRVATTLPRDGAPAHGFGRYRAADYDELVDHPVETGEFALTSFHAGGVEHEVAISGRQHADLSRLERDLARICQWQIDLFGGAPFTRYLFGIAAVGDGYGGLEHRDSTSLLVSRDELPIAGAEGIDDGYLSFLGLASHEYFHAWNIKRIKPAAFSPYDLARENYTRLLWAFEGITSYYDDLALVRCGLIDAPRYLELLARTFTSVLRTRGRLVQSVAESSFDAWIKFYRPDGNSPNAVVSYYAKGALVACALDLMLREDRRSSLDHLMRALWARHGTTATGVPEGGITQLASELAGRDLSDFFARHVQGTEDLPLAALFAEFGVTLRLRPSTGVADRGGKTPSEPPPRSGLGARVGRDLTLAAVVPDGPAALAGLSAGDLLVAIDGIKASTDVLERLMRQCAPGEPLALHVFRRDELLSASLVLAPALEDTCELHLDTAASTDALVRRNAWLGQRE